MSAKFPGGGGGSFLAGSLIPRSHSADFDRAFSVQGPKLLNSLPADIRDSTFINKFKKRAEF